VQERSGAQLTSRKMKQGAVVVFQDVA